MRLAFIALDTPTRRSSWSGTPSFAYDEIRRRFSDTHLIDTIRFDRILGLGRHVRKFAGYDLLREPLVTRAYARLIEPVLEEITPDAIISVGASHKLADISPKWPIVHISDALFSLIVDYYPSYKSMSARHRRLGNEVQQKLIDRAKVILLTSDWAVDAARRDYDIKRGTRLLAVPLGANLEKDPPPLQMPDEGPGIAVPLKLLFVGGDWTRKGGPLVLDTFSLLRMRIPDAELHIVGCRPEDALDRPGVTVHGSLSKADPAEFAKLTQLYAGSSMFFMPSRQEAYGIAYCEACAYGLPSIALNTGGVPTIIKNNVNGLLLDIDVTAESCAAEIERLWQNRPAWVAMRMAARKAYETRLNWRSWGDAVEKELCRIVSK